MSPACKTVATHLVLVLVPLASCAVLEVKEGETFAVNCPKPELSGVPEFWIHPSGRKLTSSVEGKDTQTTEDGSYSIRGTNLTIQSASLADAGLFTCIGLAGARITSGSVKVVVRPAGQRYWQYHTTNVILAVAAAVIFLLVCTVALLAHHCRYERRHKPVGANSEFGFNGAHSNPTLDVESESHL